ncbi:MAG: hypothetical protein NZT92_12355 [Abditibacteriales bacterium]|nr:hypothetical protein [Abditibacteriales bacterium]MDW8366757.1 hypothetical protein [Abditibacteriales bacterium]
MAFGAIVTGAGAGVLVRDGADAVAVDAVFGGEDSARDARRGRRVADVCCVSVRRSEEEAAPPAELLTGDGADKGF